MGQVSGGSDGVYTDGTSARGVHTPGSGSAPERHRPDASPDTSSPAPEPPRTPDTGRVPNPDAGGLDPDVIDPRVVMAQARHENFPVASVVLRPEHRRHLLAVYGFARLVDDIGDEAAGDRVAQLDAFEADLRRVFDGTPQLEVLRALQPTVRECDLPVEPFLGLIAANRQDQTTTRYDTYPDLIAYCELSANPVGRLVLHVFGRATEERIARSDEICTALQIIEHLQDVAEDLDRNRVYLPREDLEGFGVREDDLGAPTAGPALRKLVAFENDRADNLLRAGAPLVASLRGRERLAVAGFVAGGQAASAAIRRAGHDVLGRRPRPGKAALLARFAGLLVRQRPGVGGGRPAPGQQPPRNPRQQKQG